MTPAPHGYVIAIDAGGTHTRVGCFSPDGELLGHATGPGGSPNHNDDARRTVRGTIAAALEDGDLSPADSLALVAGIAGIEREGSNQRFGGNDWAAGFVDLDGLGGPRITVNDAVIAHRGALAGRPGIIVVAGTGSMILAISANGTEVESGQLEHYAGAARHLVYEAVQRILIDEAAAEDPLLEAALAHFGVPDIAALRTRFLSRTAIDRQENKRLYGAFAPVVTRLAATSVVADAAIRELAHRTVRGVRLLAPLVEGEVVPVAVTGSMATDPAFRARLEEELRGAPGPVESVAASLNPLGGAALLALDAAGGGQRPGVTERLSQHAATSAA